MRGIPTKINFKLWCLLMVALFSRIPIHTSDSNLTSNLGKISLHGSFNFQNTFHAAIDFGNRYRAPPLAVFRPKTVSDIAATIKHVSQMQHDSRLTIAARGHGHSLQGQAQAPDGIVVMMESLKEPQTRVHSGKVPYVDVCGGALWIDVLEETLKHGLAPRSWTDYLHLSVGGTLSNAGLSGQAFRHGPQISNVYQMEIITGKGEVINCTPERNADLFFAVLGGLGQFGIITRARIALEPAPEMVRWIRVLYSNFTIFAEDQEMLVSANNSFDFIEGFVIKNRTGLLNDWRSSSFSPQDPIRAGQYETQGKTLFCLEMTKNFNPNDIDRMNQEVNKLLSNLRYIPYTLFQSDISYVGFLDRVHTSELKLRAKGLWDVPHPWLNLLILKTQINNFAEEVFSNIISDSSNGPILIYALNKSKWDNRTSAVVPEEEVFYLVAFLSSVPSMSDNNGLKMALDRNEKILEFCEKSGIRAKQYLPHYTKVEDWKAHFGKTWDAFVQRKQAYDPLAILAPGQRIFQRKVPAQMLTGFITSERKMKSDVNSWGIKNLSTDSTTASHNILKCKYEESSLVLIVESFG